MIDFEKSAMLNNMCSDDLKEWFIKYPQSNKKIVCICDNSECKKERTVKYQDYYDLCHKCGCSTSEVRKANQHRRILYYEDNPEAREAVSDSLIKYYNDNPVSDKTKVKLSEAIKKHYDEMEDPGQQIVNHHYIYDFNDLDKYTIPVTRSEHTTIHNNLRCIGLEVPHINIMKEC